MANYNCVAVDLVSAVGDPPRDDSNTFPWLMDGYAGAIPAQGDPVYDSQEYQAVMERGLMDVILDNVYVEPLEVDGGLIIEVSEQDIFIWNSWLVPQIITEITELDPLGTQLDRDTLPIYLYPGCEDQHLLTILEDGPAIQETHYVYNIGFFQFDLHVVGKRVLVWRYEADWSRNPKMKYTFETIISRNEIFREQRRPLIPEPEITLIAKFTFEGVEKQRFLNETRYFKTRIIGIPVFPEALETINDLKDQTIIYFDKECWNYWNLQRLDYVLVRSTVDYKKAELKQVQSRGSNYIVTALKVFCDIKAGEGVVYPVFFGIIKGFNSKLETERLLEATIEFRQIETGSQAETITVPPLVTWNPDIDWSNGVSYKFDHAMKIIEYKGTVPEMVVLSEDKPHKYEMSLVMSKTEEFAVLTQFVSLMGRYRRFLLPSPQNLFSLKTNYAPGATFITIHDNAFDFRGYEWIYFLLYDGTYRAHSIVSSVRDEINEEITLEITPALDVHLVPDEIEKFSLLLLMRLENDALNISYESGDVSEAKISAVELPREYVEL